jgi:hypothetical protein
MRDAGLRRLGVVCCHCNEVIALRASTQLDGGDEALSVVCPSCKQTGHYCSSDIGTLVGRDELEWRESWFVRLWRRLRALA